LLFRKKIEDSFSLEKLIKGCSKGDRKAQEALFSVYYGYAMSVALRYSYSREKAADITNEGFLKIFSNIQLFRGEAEFKSWLRKIIVNTALDHYRKEKKHEKQVPIQNGVNELADESVINQLQAEDILRIVQSLPEIYRFTFNLYEIEGYSHEEIALKLGTTAGTSRANLSRAKHLLRQMILNLSTYERVV
jgi:RNA polymerase sigma factor (sigma-70 family)